MPYPAHASPRALRAGATRVPPAHPSRPGMRHAAHTHARTCRCGVPQVVWAKELTNTLKACTLIAAQLGKPGADPAESDRLMVAAAASGGEAGGAAQRAQRDERPWLSGGAKKKKKAVGAVDKHLDELQREMARKESHGEQLGSLVVAYERLKRQHELSAEAQRERIAQLEAKIAERQKREEDR